jgi:hypothetical protein
MCLQTRKNSLLHIIKIMTQMLEDLIDRLTTSVDSFYSFRLGLLLKFSLFCFTYLENLLNEPLHHFPIMFLELRSVDTHSALQNQSLRTV